MKKFFVSILTAVIAVSCIAFTACTKEDKHSTAVGNYELIRENYAAEKEAEDDAAGREHIEIPADAETIDIDGEEYVVLRSIEDFDRKIYANTQALSGSYILANDIDVKNHRISESDYFYGHLNGNNYKFYSTEETGGLYGSLFNEIENAIIENVIFSASDGYFDWYSGFLPAKENLIAYCADNCIIRNCINYFQPKNRDEKGFIAYFGGFINGAENCNIENCVNYADLIASGGIVAFAEDCHIVNCKNYGNIMYTYESGGIVGKALYDNIIENCINYGNIAGTRYKGGILGGVSLWASNAYPYKSGLLNKRYYTELVIKNCTNYGNIYMRKSNDADSRVESVDDRWGQGPEIYAIGGIAGSASKVENCRNEGNFYGFESLGKGIKVNYTGGVVGVAREVVDCSNTGTMVIHKGRAKNVGDIYGYLL